MSRWIQSGSVIRPIRILANALATITEYIAIWIEDENGRVIASNGPANLIAEFSGGKRWTDNFDDDLVVPPHRATGLFGLPVVAVIRTAEHEVLGTIVVLVDFGPIASILMDTSGLDETGEVLVGVKQAESIRLITPTRGRTPKSEERASGMPALHAAINGEFGSSAPPTIEVRTCWWLTARSVAGLPAGVLLRRSIPKRPMRRCGDCNGCSRHCWESPRSCWAWSHRT